MVIGGKSRAAGAAFGVFLAALLGASVAAAQDDPSGADVLQSTEQAAQPDTEITLVDQPPEEAVQPVQIHPDVPEIDENGRPALIPTEAFSSRSMLGTAKISPDGKHFAFILRSESWPSLIIVDTDTFSLSARIPVGGETIRWFRWAGPDKLLISTTIRYRADFYRGYASQLRVFDLPSAEVHRIGLEEQGLEGDDVLHTDPDGRFLLLSLSDTGTEPPAVWRFPLDGSGPESAVRVLEPQNGIDEWWADDAGAVRLGMKRTGNSARIFYYRDGPDGQFERVSKVKQGDDQSDYWDVLGLYSGTSTGYSLSEGLDGRTVLREFDYATGQPGKIVYENPDWDVDSVIFGPENKPIGVQFTDDRRRAVWLDPELAKAQSALEQALPGQAIEILSAAPGGRMLVLHGGAGDPGALYVYKPGERKLDLFDNLRPEIDHRLLADPKPVTITARDGVELPAYLTLPRGRRERALPMILMPHGGPYGVRDQLVYDDWVQLLANRGYAVLQPNFRGSGGYGKAFEELGDGQIGRAMQDDLDDAADWAVAQGIADPARICVVGGSYGGYAALWAVTRNPERYACAASWAGVTDFDQQLRYSLDYIGRRYRGDWKDKVRGDERGFDLQDVSPAQQIARLTRPVLLAHGNRDYVVPFTQYRTMVEAARKAGKELDMLELNDGHGLSDRRNEQLWYDRLIEFLDKHNPAD